MDSTKIIMQKSTTYKEIDKDEAIQVVLNNWLESFDDNFLWIEGVMRDGYSFKPLHKCTTKELQKEIDNHDIMFDYTNEIYYKVIK